MKILSVPSRRRFQGVALFVALLLAALTTVRATEYLVNDLADTKPTTGGAGAGTTGDLRYCISQANFGATGTTHRISFAVTGTITLAGRELVIKSDLSIVGPGAPGITIDANQASRAIYVAANHSVGLFNLTLINGNGNGNDFTGIDPGTGNNGKGGAILNDGSSLVLESCTVSDNGKNGSFLGGGGIYNQATGADAALLLFGSNVLRNTAYNPGGGVCNFSSGSFTATVSGGGQIDLNTTPRNGGGIANTGPHSNVMLTGGTVDVNSAGNGGGIYSDTAFGRVEVSNTEFSDNAATDSGGGVSNDRGSTMTLSGCFFFGNTAGGNGGGINSDNSGFDTPTLTLSHCNILKNTAVGAGGGVYNRSSSETTLHFIGTTISENSAKQGGGIYNYSTNSKAVLTLVNSTVAKNSAQQRGGGIYNDANAGTATVTLANCTIAGNSAVGGGGGIANDRAQNNTNGAATVTLSNTLLALNPTGANFDSLLGTNVSGGFNLSDDATGVSFLTAGGDKNSVVAGLQTDSSGQPLLLPQENGIEVKTVALLAGSAAIDAGKAAPDPVTGLTTDRDQRGDVRPFNVTTVANAAGGDGSDIGAFESGSTVPPPPVVAEAGTATGQAGVAFSYQIVASNSPESFSVYGLPAGLFVDLFTGLITGTPTVAGTFQVTLNATNAGGTGSGSLTLVIELAGPNPVVTSAPGATGEVGVAFSFQIVATHSPSSYAASNVPVGLSVNATTGLISGTPTVTGTFTITLTVTNASGTGSATLTLTIAAAAATAPVITSVTATSARTGQPFRYQIVAGNGATGYGATGLPAGLTLNVTTGLITGTPTGAGVFSIVLTATNAAGTATVTLTLTLSSGPVVAPVINNPVLNADIVQGQPFSYQISATNSPTSYGATGLPIGLSIDVKTGAISGAPTQTGVFTVTLSVTNAAGTGTAILTLTIGLAEPTVTLVVTTPTVVAGSGEFGVFTLIISEAQDHDVFVHYTVKGSAANGVDYNFLKGIKKIKAGKTSKTIKVIPVGGLGGANKKVVTLLLAQGDGYAVGTTAKVKVKILAGP